MHRSGLHLLNQPNPRRRRTEAFLLGQVDFDVYQALQERMVFDACSRADGRISLLLCEHAPIITIGRGGSRADVQLRAVQLAGRQVDLVHVNRGGGTMLHLPGQLAVYPIVPLEWHGWTVGEFVYRFQRGLLTALAQLQIKGRTYPNRHGVWGRSGQLISFGLAVKHWITYYGAVINVAPALPIFRYIDTDTIGSTRAGSLSEEQRRAMRMTSLRSRVVRAVAESFGCDQYHTFTSHPLLPEAAKSLRETARAS